MRPNIAREFRKNGVVHERLTRKMKKVHRYPLPFWGKGKNAQKQSYLREREKKRKELINGKDRNESLNNTAITGPLFGQRDQ